MTFKKKVKTKFKSFLRRIGLLCKKPQPPKRKIHISRSIQPDGTVVEYDSPLDKIPLNPSSFESELHVWKEIHKNKFEKPQKSKKGRPSKK